MKTEFTKKDAEAAVNAVVSSVEDTLKNGEKVQLIGFGTFEVRNRKARQEWQSCQHRQHDCLLPQGGVQCVSHRFLFQTVAVFACRRSGRGHLFCARPIGVRQGRCGRGVERIQML